MSTSRQRLAQGLKTRQLVQAHGKCYIITDNDLDDDKIDDGDVDADAVKVDNAPNANDIDDLLLFGSD